VNERDRARRDFVVLGSIAIAISILFFVLISSGYFLLFRGNIVVAVLSGLLFGSVAVLIAYWLGMQENGIRKYFPVFVFLLAISALGVFNSFMLNFEGRYIFTDAIEESQSDFQKLEGLIDAELKEEGLAVRLARIDGLRSALISEINNPMNCGQGPEARRLIAELQRELPGFQPLSSAGIDCSRNEEVIADYNSKISSLIERAAWNEPELVAASAAAKAARAELGELYGTASNSFGNALLGNIKPRLQALDDEYRRIYQNLAGRGAVNKDTPNSLPLLAVQTLGEPSQFLNLILARIWQVSTWFYIALAIGLDWFMTYLWGTVRASRSRRGGSIARKSKPGSAW
jgi:hypothetical protein